MKKNPRVPGRPRAWPKPGSYGRGLDFKMSPAGAGGRGLGKPSPFPTLIVCVLTVIIGTTVSTMTVSFMLKRPVTFRIDITSLLL